MLTAKFTACKKTAMVPGVCEFGGFHTYKHSPQDAPNLVPPHQMVSASIRVKFQPHCIYIIYYIYLAQSSLWSTEYTQSTHLFGKPKQAT